VLLVSLFCIQLLSQGMTGQTVSTPKAYHYRPVLTSDSQPRPVMYPTITSMCLSHPQPKPFIHYPLLQHHSCFYVLCYYQVSREKRKANIQIKSSSINFVVDVVWIFLQTILARGCLRWRILWLDAVQEKKLVSWLWQRYAYGRCRRHV